ncbi:MAG: FAD-binding protein [Planctomycetes bacterium]|nr:FAD-binding protein [Planctomycetota bacterium]MCB9910173.1 FAD-binding protein [Planctomycetota bacterium]HPF15004.1 FAD-binding protein [Planctomycetota bacterium]HRV81570.1 FAD-binding protein [Planctomycetota bacterium]
MNCEANWPCVALENASLAERTTMRVGGSVRWLLEPTSPDELRGAYLAALESGLPIRFLGGGANIVAADGTWNGVVISSAQMRRIFRPLPGTSDTEGMDAGDADFRMAMPEPAYDPRLIAWAGCTLPALVRTTKGLGYSGLEGLMGVPGHVGGGIAMNAGGSWGDIWDHIEFVRLLNPEGEFVDVPRAAAHPTYRNGNLNGGLVVGAVWKLEPAPKLVVEARIREYLLHKQKVQPVTQWSAGCVFKNPDPERSEGRSAGKLVDDVGLKGFAIGDAQVSPLHGNFIVNLGKASASQVFELMDQVQDRVAQATGVELEFEVKRWLAQSQQ